mmetsp:Transcript_115851/g.368347  ORF Transcript_115851/g.368347 Transcript_115851/m.368347 type:complete len:91 (+) Transcript_115851:322-594(+)
MAPCAGRSPTRSMTNTESWPSQQRLARAVLQEFVVIWYAAFTTPQGQNLTASACLAADGVPPEFNMTTGLAYKSASLRVNVSHAGVRKQQ